MIYKLIFLQSPEDYQVMNRSYSHNFRTFPNNKNKSNLSRSSANFQFRTVWKTRDTHQTFEPKKTVILHNSSKIQAEQPTPLLGETAGHQQMRQFIKMMKKNPNQIRSEQTSKSCANPSQNLQQNSGSHVSPVQIIKKNSVPSLGINKIKPVVYNNTCQSSRSVRSTKSVKSNAKSIRQSRAQSHIESQTEDYKADTRFRESTYDLKEQKNSEIEDLERKIQLAIQTKLQKFSGRPRQTINSTSSEDELDKQLKKLLKNLQDIPSQPSASTDTDIRKLAHKIGIIEKLMASSSTQHEILKKYYFSTQNIRKNYATINDQAWKDSKPVASDDMKAGKNWSEKFVMTTPPSIHYQTTTGTAFIPPSRNSYTGQHQKRAPYIPNRQPMPRSLYQREFLYYGIVPTYSSYSPHQQNLSQTDPKLSESIAEQESEAKLLTRAESTYKQDYKCKKVQLVDSKQLDCRRDKHRNADVNFMGNRSDFTSVYEHNLKKALNINRSSCGGKRYQSKKGQDGKENVHRNFRNNSFSKKCPLSAHPNHNSSQSQIQLSKPLPFNSKTENQSQFKDPYPLSTTFNVNISQVARTDKQEQRSSGENKCLGNLTSQKGKKGVLEAYIKQKNLNNLKYLYKCEFAI